MAGTAEDIYKRYFMTMPAMMGTVAFDGLFAVLNPAWEQQLGFPPSEMAGKPYLDFIHPEDRSLAAEAQRKALDGGPHSRFDARFLCRDGGYKWLNTRLAGDTDKKFFYIVSADIAARKEVETSLRDNREDLQRFLEQAPIPVGIRDKAGDLKFINRKFTEVFGYTAGEIFSFQDWCRRAYPDPAVYEAYKAQWNASLEAAGRSATGEIPPAEYRIVCKDGSVKIVNLVGLVTAEGHLAVMFEDITSQAETIRVLRESEATLRKIFEASPMAMAMHSRDGRIEYVNAKFTKTLGYSLEDIPDKETWALKVAPDAAYRAEIMDKWSAALRKAAETGGEMESQEFRFACKDGAQKLIRICGVITAGRVFAIFDDVTESVKAARALKDSEITLRNILEQAPLAIAIQNLDNGLEFVNHKFNDYFGYAPGELPTLEAWARLAYPDEAYRNKLLAWQAQQVEKCLKNPGEMDPIEVEVACRGGGKKQVRVTGVITPDRKIVSLLEDITVQAQAEKGIRENESALRRILEQAPVCIGVHTLDGRLDFAHTKFVQTFGYKPEDIPDLDAWAGRAYPEEGYRKRTMLIWREWIEKSRRTGLEMEGGEFRVVCKDGSEKTVYITGVVTADKKVVALLDDITARVKAEKALRESESLYRALVETTGTGYVVLDGGGKVLDANREYVRLSGHSDLKEILGRSVLAWTAPHSQQRAQEALDIAVRDGRVSGFEVDYVDRAGKFATIEINATVVSRDGVQQILGLCRDVSARSKTEAQVRESEALYRALVETTATGYVVADGNFTVVDANREYARLTGHREPAEIIGRSIMEWTVPDMRERNAAGLRKCFTERRLRHFELDYQTESGKLIPVEGSVTVVTRHGVPHLLSLCRDVTERRKTEAQLRDSESLYRALVETTRTGYVVVSADGTVLDANSEYVRLTGHSELKEILGRRVTEWTAPDKVGENAAAVAQCARDGHISNFETDYVDRAGKRTPVEINATVVERAGSPQIHTLCRDITQRRADAAEREELNRSLEKRVQERTAELMETNVELSHEIALRTEAERERIKLQEELLQSQKMEVVGRLSAGIAHDFNNILVAISGYAEFLMQTLPEGAQAREDLGEIVRETERGALLTRQLMAIGRKQPVELKVMSVNSVAQDSARMLKRLVGSNMNLETRLDPEAAQIKADEGQVSQVLMNLVVNARDAMPEGGKLVISTGNEDIAADRPPMFLMPRPGKYVTVSVSDTGTGMSPETLAHIFDPFFTTKAEGKGTGLGLSTVYGIVHQAGGGIEVKTAPGQGTTFKIYFPRIAD